jgi:hypothetical protein
LQNFPDSKNFPDSENLPIPETSRFQEFLRSGIWLSRLVPGFALSSQRAILAGSEQRMRQQHIAQTAPGFLVALFS